MASVESVTNSIKVINQLVGDHMVTKGADGFGVLKTLNGTDGPQDGYDAAKVGVTALDYGLKIAEMAGRNIPGPVTGSVNFAKAVLDGRKIAVDYSAGKDVKLNDVYSFGGDVTALGSNLTASAGPLGALAAAVLSLTSIGFGVAALHADVTKQTISNEAIQQYLDGLEDGGESLLDSIGDFTAETIGSFLAQLFDLFDPDVAEEVIKETQEAYHNIELLTSPIVLDLDGDGVETTASNGKSFFDHDANRFAELTGWVGHDDGLLVRDLNGNGLIDDGTELFGNHTLLTTGVSAENGFQALSEMDSNNDSSIDSFDAEFNSLGVWKDGNGDGIVQAGELKSLSAVGVGSLSLSYAQSDKVDAQGNHHKQLGSYVTVDGSVREMHDVWFDVNNARTVDKDLVSITEQVALLPEVKGMGNVYDLSQAMMRDESGVLRQLVSDFKSEGLANRRDVLVDQIILKWSGVDGVAKDSRAADYMYGNAIGDARILAALEKLLGEDYVGTWCWGEKSPNPHLPAAVKLLQLYDIVHEAIKGQLLLQTHLGDDLSNLVIVISPVDGTVSWDISNLVSSFEAKFQADPGKALSEINDLGSGLNAAGSFGVDILNQFKVTPSSHAELQEAFENIGKRDVNFSDSYNGNILKVAPEGVSVLFGVSGNEQFVGSNGETTYMFEAGNGQDHIVNYDTDVVGTNLDTIIFGSSVLSGEVVFSRDNYDLIISVGNGIDTIQVYSFFEPGSWYNEKSAIDLVKFSDGTFYTAFDISQYVMSHEIPTGIRGTSGDDILEGTSADEKIDMGKGNDIYHFSSNGGTDHLINFDSTPNRVDSVALSGDYTTANTKITRSGLNLEISSDFSTSKLVVFNFFYEELLGNYKIDNLLFQSGETWDLLEIYRQASHTTEGDDEIHGASWDEILLGKGGRDLLWGNGGDDVLDGGTGNDSLIGGVGSDTYWFGLGYGNDEIWERGVSGEQNVIKFHSDITPADIHLTSYREDLIVESIGTTDSLQITGFLYREQDSTSLINTVGLFQFADGTTWDVDKVLQMLQGGSSYNDVIYGGDEDNVFYGQAGNDVLVGRGGDDILHGGDGNDQIVGDSGNDILRGGAGDDWLQDGAGDDDLDGGYGNDRYEDSSGLNTYYLYDNSGTDTIVYLNDTNPRIKVDGDLTEVTFGKDSAGKDLVISLGSGNNAQLIISYFFASYVGTGFTLFNDFLEITYSRDDIIAVLPVGTENSDHIEGTSLNDVLNGLGGNDVINGLAGDDIISGGTGDDTLSGGEGNNTYHYAFGDGVDTIRLDGSTDKLILGAGITRDSTNFYRLEDDLYMVFSNSADKQIFVPGFFSSHGKKFADITYIDGQIILGSDVEGLSEPYPQPDQGSGLPWAGYAEDMVILGTVGDDIVAGGPGNEFFGGSGTDRISGGAGNDHYLYIQGKMEISEGGGELDVLTFYGVSWARVSQGVARWDNDLVFNLDGDTVNQVIVKDYFLGGENIVEAIRFSGGELLTPDLVLELLSTSFNAPLSQFSNSVVDSPNINSNLTGTFANDLIQGFNGNDILFGGGGNDRLEGGNGNDSLFGGEGNDTLVGGRGDDLYLFALGDGVDRIINKGGGYDTLHFSGLTISQVNGGLQKTGNDLTFNVAGGSESITVVDWFLGGDSYVDRITFEDGQVTGEQIFSSLGLTSSGSFTPDYGYLPEDRLFHVKISGTDGDDNIYSSSFSDFIDAGAGSDFIVSGKGDDYIIGGNGNDTYYMVSDFGNDVINNISGTSNDTDSLFFQVSAKNLWFSKTGDDLLITALNSSNSVTVQDWYGSSSAQIDTFTASGAKLDATSVENLVSSMAVYGSPVSGRIQLTGQQQNEVDSIIASSWNFVQVPNVPL
ncbi:calcium binding hemolysin protein [Paucimonas lemoignei]|nr:calcium binding hemolysin protein [Paucimonas lemoignei]